MARFGVIFLSVVSIVFGSPFERYQSQMMSELTKLQINTERVLARWLSPVGLGYLELRQDLDTLRNTFEEFRRFLKGDR